MFESQEQIRLFSQVFTAIFDSAEEELSKKAAASEQDELKAKKWAEERQALAEKRIPEEELFALYNLDADLKQLVAEEKINSLEAVWIQSFRLASKYQTQIKELIEVAKSAAMQGAQQTQELIEINKKILKALQQKK